MNIIKKLSLTDLLQTIEQLTTYSDTDVTDGITRFAYSQNDELAHQYIIKQAEQHGLSCRQDNAGNVFITLPGQDQTLAAVATGSHLDTVPNGGKYDGMLGVVAGLYALTQFKAGQLRRSLTLIIFRNEESSRFGISCIGSKILTGNIDQEKWLKAKDNQDKSLFQAIDEAGYQSGKLAQSELADDDYSAFVELHIEQGKCLETAKKPIGIVNGIAAPTRFQIDVYGQADHSGATPMNQRHDALVTAASLITTVNALANSEAYLGTVATVGKLNVYPNAMNVIPGHVRFYVDIRGIDLDSINRTVQSLQQEVNRIQIAQHIDININMLSQEVPVKLNQQVCQLISQLCQDEHIDYLDMLSGAGHDAMYMAKKYPTAMVFIPSKAGISHHKDEFSSPDEIILGATLLTKTLEKLANQPEIIR